MAETSAEHERGPRFGKYVPIANLGQGGMADVFLSVARGPMDFQKLAVIKLLRAGYVGDAVVRGMFLDEARIAARLNHANVVDTYEVGEEDGTLFLAMEYLEGQPLSAIIAEARLCGERTPPGLALRLVSDALNGLHYAHELTDFDGTKLHIVHRDVSPHNIFVTYDGRVKLMDFGIAKAAHSIARTDAGVLKGKVRYMSPEQARGDEVDRRADVFAMGICLWELLTSEPLLPVNSPMSALHKLTNETLPTVASTLPEVEPRISAIVEKALARRPDDRWPTAAAMREAIEEYLRASGTIVQQDDVAKHMADAFEELREQIRADVKAAMVGLSSEGTDPRRRQKKLGSLAARDRLLDLARRSAEPTAGGLVQPGAAETAAAARRRRVTLVLAVGATLTVTATLVGVGARSREGPAPIGVAGSASGGAPAETGELAAAPSSTAPGPLPSPSPATSPGPVASPSPSSTGARTTATAGATRAGRGLLTLDTYPWSRVSEGGRVLGVTPLVDVPLPAGVHTLTFENPDSNLRRSITVTIKAGETLSKRVALD